MSPTQRGSSMYADFLLPHLSDETDLVDVGCGDGELTVDLARSVRSVVAIDIDQEDLAGARARARRESVGNATFEVADVYALGLADGVADVVLGHSVLEALEHPVRALAEMRRLLRSGGVVGVASVEYGGLILAGPHEDLLRRFYAIREQLWIREGADPYLGRRLRSLLSESGFRDVEASTKAIPYGTSDLVATFGRGRADDCVDEWYVTSAVEAGLSTSAEIEQMHDAWLEWAESPASYASFTWCRALGWKWPTA